MGGEKESKKKRKDPERLGKSNTDKYPRKGQEHKKKPKNEKEEKNCIDRKNKRGREKVVYLGGRPGGVEGGN